MSRFTMNRLVERQIGIDPVVDAIGSAVEALEASTDARLRRLDDQLSNVVMPPVYRDIEALKRAVEAMEAENKLLRSKMAECQRQIGKIVEEDIPALPDRMQSMLDLGEVIRNKTQERLAVVESRIAVLTDALSEVEQKDRRAETRADGWYVIQTTPSVRPRTLYSRGGTFFAGPDETYPFPISAPHWVGPRIEMD